MKLTFNIKYLASWGETLCIIGSADNLQWSESSPLVMSCIAPEVWRATIELPASTIVYHYAVRRTDGSYRHEWGNRCFELKTKDVSVNLVEYWQEIEIERVFTHKPFSDNIFARKRSPRPPHSNYRGKAITFCLHAPEVAPGQGIAIMGNLNGLGCWDSQRKLIMSDARFPWWEVTIDPEQCLIEYKYAIYDLSDGHIIDFEAGDNRLLDPALSNEGVIICHDYGFRRTTPHWRGTGSAIPVFSLRTHESFGIGEFPDLVKFGQWAAGTGQKIIQTLPVNDTTLQHTNRDSYPYNAVSVFALNPIYINVEKMGQLKPSDLKSYQKTQHCFNAKSFADYQAVADEKAKYFRLIYQDTKEELFASDDFKKFFSQNKSWLQPYAAFCYLRDKEGTACFKMWKQYTVGSPQVIKAVCSTTSPGFDDVALHYFLQYHADKQLKEAHEALKNMGIGLKGDIPIGISPNSVDAWVHPELFHLDTQAGAPPDAFSVSGQNWGFPTYNWNAMAKDGYDWFCRRFRKMADYFDAYRIDHILGFFRIWEMPLNDVWGLTGRFCPALPYTLQELRDNGIDLSLERLTTPYINVSFLPEMFGDLADFVKRTFLTSSDGEKFDFKPEFDTQRKIKDWFAGYKADNNTDNKVTVQLRDKLYLLQSEVLFLEDLHTPGLYHPRIALQQSHSYAALSHGLQQKLSHLHDDFFYHRNEEVWKASAMRKLPSLAESSDMLVCAEDLGMVPACVSEVMKELNILSLEIQRMPKCMAEFSRPADAPYMSVCTTSSHDTNPLRAWWEEDSQRTQRYYSFILGHQGEAPQHATPSIIREIIAQHLSSPAMWVILPIQDWLALDDKMALPDIHAERINVPDNPHNFWSYRMHLNIEELLSATTFNRQLRVLNAR